MVAPAAITARIERSLTALLAEVNDLATVGAEWQSLPEWNQASIALDWSHLMADYLTELDNFYRSDAMTADQQARFNVLRGQLTTSLPIIARLNLYRPPIPLDD